MDEPVDPFRQRLLALPVFARELIAGGLAGGLAKTCVAPLERTKILFQTTGTQSNVLGILQGIVEREGAAGLFKGNGASVARIVPYAAIHFGSYEYFRRLFIEQVAPHITTTSSSSSSSSVGIASPSSPIWDLLAGSASGAAAVLATYPLDLIRTRLAWASEQVTAGSVHHHHEHHRLTIRSLLKRTVAEEGVPGLFRGVVPTMLGILPYAGLKFYVYQLLKGWYRQPTQQQLAVVPSTTTSSSSSQEALANSSSGSSNGRKKEGRGDRLPVPVMLTFGGIAGLLAQTVTYPLDVIRRQMQVQGLRQLHADEGPTAALVAAQRHASSSSGSGGTWNSARSTTGRAAAADATGLAGQSAAQAGPSSSYSSSSRSATRSTAPYAASRLQTHPTGLPTMPAAASLYQQAARGVSQAGGAGAGQQAAHHLERLSVAATTRQLVAAGGWASLFRGLSLNYMKVVPSTAIGFTIYDALKAYLELSSNL